MQGPVEVAVIGAGNVGISVAYYLLLHHRIRRIALIDQGEPMALTSAQSGENYRNWWPHPVMTAFTDHAIDLLEQIAAATANRIAMTRRGYLLATRNHDPAALIEQLHQGYGPAASAGIRVHEHRAGTYRPPEGPGWEHAPTGVDILLGQPAIRRNFPALAADVATIVHIRRAGDISGQQLGQAMLKTLRAAGIRVRRAKVVGIAAAPAGFDLALHDGAEAARLRAGRVVNAAGPYFAGVAAMLGERLPVACVFQQKLAFEDRAGAIPRTLPFTIDLDGQEIPWTAEERELLAADPASAALLRPMPGGIHRRPEGGEGGAWVKLGWAYNTAPSDPAAPPPYDPHFPDILLRAASRLTPALGAYVGKLPRGARHYGGYYAMTPENWPLLGAMATPGAFMAGALSGFGTMAATASGAVCAAAAAGAPLPAYAAPLGLARYDDPALMRSLAASASKGVL